MKKIIKFNDEKQFLLGLIQAIESDPKFDQLPVGIKMNFEQIKQTVLHPQQFSRIVLVELVSILLHLIEILTGA